MNDPSDINAGVAEQPLASVDVSALSWALGGYFLGNFVNDGKSFSERTESLTTTHLGNGLSGIASTFFQVSAVTGRGLQAL